MHEHPLQRFFKSLRERPVFAWERYQMRDVLVIDHPLCQAVFSRQGAQLLHFQPRVRSPGFGVRRSGRRSAPFVVACRCAGRGMAVIPAKMPGRPMAGRG
jgi:hypothetical protein